MGETGCGLEQREWEGEVECGLVGVEGCEGEEVEVEDALVGVCEWEGGGGGKEVEDVLVGVRGWEVEEELRDVVRVRGRDGEEDGDVLGGRGEEMVCALVMVRGGETRSTPESSSSSSRVSWG